MRRVICACGVIRSEAEIWNHIEVQHDSDPYHVNGWRVIDNKPPAPRKGE